MFSLINDGIQYVQLPKYFVMNRNRLNNVRVALKVNEPQAVLTYRYVYMYSMAQKEKQLLWGTMVQPMLYVRNLDEVVLTLSEIEHQGEISFDLLYDTRNV